MTLGSWYLRKISVCNRFLEIPGSWAEAAWGRSISRIPSWQPGQISHNVFCLKDLMLFWDQYLLATLLYLPQGWRDYYFIFFLGCFLGALARNVVYCVTYHFSPVRQSLLLSLQFKHKRQQVKYRQRVEGQTQINVVAHQQNKCWWVFQLGLYARRVVKTYVKNKIAISQYVYKVILPNEGKQ